MKRSMRKEIKMKNCEGMEENQRKDVENMNENRGKENEEEKFHDEIAKVAYHLWEISGKVPGKDLENWNNAKKIVLALHEDDERKNDMGEKSMRNENTKGMMGRSEMMKKRHMKKFRGKAGSEE